MVREDKDAAACKLAAAHYEVEVGITQIFRLTGTAEAEGLPDEPIKLLEVNENTIPAGIMPPGLRPGPDVRHPLSLRHRRGDSGRIPKNPVEGTCTPEGMDDQ